MVTKLRNFSTKKATKAIAFILLVALIVSVITQFLVATYKRYSFETVFSKEYIYSDNYRQEVYSAIGSIVDALNVRNFDVSRSKISEIKKGRTYINEDIVTIDYFNDFAVGQSYIDKTLEGKIDINELDEYRACEKYVVMYRDYIGDIITKKVEMYGDFGNRDSEIYYIRAYRDYVNEIMSHKDNIDYHISDKFINSYGSLNFYYYATNGEQTFANVQFSDKSEFEKLAKEVYFYEKGIWSKGENTLSNYLDRNGWWDDIDSGKNTFYLAFSDDSIAQIQAQWDIAHSYAFGAFINIIGQVICGILIFIFLVIVTGREPNDKQLHLAKIDNIYSDVLLAMAFIVFGITISIGADVSYVQYGHINNASYFTNGLILKLVFYGILVAIGSIACIYIALSLIRKIKAGKLLKHSLIFTVLFAVYDFFRSIFDGRRFEKYPLTKSLFYRQVVFISASAVLVFFTVVFAAAGTGAVLFPPILGIVVIYWYIKGNNKTFEEINKGFNESLEEQMRAERMKIALVTNVSHDLKTPLTSIISYVDLLSKEVKEQNFTNVNDYINILAEKSDRLKHIVSDLFDLAKSTSGNIELDFETLDMKKLVEQTLADMSDRIEKSQLQLKVKLPETPLLVHSDGKKLYRVLQNVIDNAIKYSLSGTRVFVELAGTNRKAVISIKNTSAYEMDFTAEEVLGRFTRGDKSRSTEGSGLGLSIAESFTNACGGSFNLSVDGDQFKILIELPKND